MICNKAMLGTIETIDGDTLTINTSRGPLQAAVGAETTIQVFADGTLADLETGMQRTEQWARWAGLLG